MKTFSHVIKYKTNSKYIYTFKSILGPIWPNFKNELGDGDANGLKTSRGRLCCVDSAEEQVLKWIVSNSPITKSGGVVNSLGGVWSRTSAIEAFWKFS